MHRYQVMYMGYAEMEFGLPFEPSEEFLRGVVQALADARVLPCEDLVVEKLVPAVCKRELVWPAPLGDQAL